jgi:hypothetical protein
MFGLGAWLLSTSASAHPAARQLHATAEERGLECELRDTTLDCRPQGSGPELPPARLELAPLLPQWDRASPSGREQLLLQWLETLPPAEDWAVPTSFAEAAPRLRLRLRPQAALVHRPDSARLPLGEHLAAELVLAGTASRRPVRTAWLEDWNISLAEAALQAARNQGAPLVPPAPSSVGSALTSVEPGPGLADVADLLPGLVLDAWGQGAVLALSRSSTELLLCPAADSDCQAALLEAAEGSPRSGVPLSHQPLLWTETGWSSWRPEPGGPLSSRWLAVIAHEHAALDEVSLPALDPAAGFHGRLSAVVREGQPGTLATWVPASATVPAADWLAVSDPSESHYLILRWDRAAPLLRDHLRPLPSHAPPRLEVARPIDGATFSALIPLAEGGVRPIR